MHVCYLINNLRGDGAQRLVLDIIDNSGEDIRFTTCAFEKYNPLEQEFREAGSNVVTFDAASKFDVRAIQRVFEYFRGADFDVLHAHLPYSQVLARVVGATGGARSVVSTQHNVPANYHPVERALERLTRPLDTTTIAVSDGVRQRFLAQSRPWETELTDWRTIYNGIDVAQFNRGVREIDEQSARDRWGVSEDDLVYVNISRYVPAKAQTDAIRAMSGVVRSIPDARMVIAGGGQLERLLQRAVANLDLEDHVTLAGRVSDRSIYELYSIADVFVFPSIHEGFGIVLLEAMASELPVVATDIPGVRDVVSNDTGVLVPSETPDELAKAMIRMRSPNRRRTFGKNGYRRALDAFDIDRVVDEHVRMYRTVSGGD